MLHFLSESDENGAAHQLDSSDPPAKQEARTVSSKMRRKATRPTLMYSPSISKLVADHAAFRPTPVDTSEVTLSKDMEDLVTLLAQNSHEVWAEGKVQQGYQYAPNRNIIPGLKLSSSLVPFRCLSQREQAKIG